MNRVIGEDAMGFDVTFHPIGADELQRFLFDVIDDPTKAESRAREISKIKKYQTAAQKLYGEMPGGKEKGS